MTGYQEGNVPEDRVDVVVIGAGPYGLSIAAHARAAGLSVRNFGRPMSAWAEHMPRGMLLKSEVWASHLSDPLGAYGYDKYCAEHNLPYAYGTPIPVETFVAYGHWFAALAADGVEARTVVRVTGIGERLFECELEDGEVVQARSVVAAVGVVPFAYTPEPLNALPEDVAGHASRYPDLSAFAGRRVAVVGAGQSAIETAALLSEADAQPHLIARTGQLAWNDVPLPGDRSWPARLRRPHSALGSGLRTWGMARMPGAVRRLPVTRRAHLVRATLGPAGAWWLRDRFEGIVPVSLGATVADAQAGHASGAGVQLKLSTGEFIEADHVISATGYRVDLDRLPLLDRELRDRVPTISTASGVAGPRLSSAFESTVPGLYFVGLPAALSFGPLLRFVAGAAFTARRVNGSLTAHAADFPSRGSRHSAPEERVKRQ